MQKKSIAKVFNKNQQLLNKCKKNMTQLQWGRYFVMDKHICASFIAFPMQENVDVISFYNIVAFYT